MVETPEVNVDNDPRDGENPGAHDRRPPRIRHRSRDGTRSGAGRGAAAAVTESYVARAAYARRPPGSPGLLDEHDRDAAGTSDGIQGQKSFHPGRGRRVRAH